jgi:hypothetical protein
LSTLSSGDSRRSSLPRESRIRQSAGVTVSATSIDTRTARPYVRTSGRKNAPDRLSRKSTGTIATTLMTVA